MYVSLEATPLCDWELACSEIELFVSANACESGLHTTRRWVRRPAPGATHVIGGLIKQYRLQHLAAAAAAVVLASMHVVGCEKYQEHLPISPVLTAADPFRVLEDPRGQGCMRQFQKIT